MNPQPSTAPSRRPRRIAEPRSYFVGRAPRDGRWIDVWYIRQPYSRTWRDELRSLQRQVIAAGGRLAGPGEVRP